MSERAYLPLQPLPVAVRWAVLFAASLLLAGALQWVRLPPACCWGRWPPPYWYRWAEGR